MTAPAAGEAEALAADFLARRRAAAAALAAEAERLTDALAAAGRPDLAEAVQAALPAGDRRARHVRAFPAPAGGFSFRAEVTRRTALSALARAAGRPLPEWVVNDKARGRQLAAALGARVAQVVATGLPPEAVTFRPGQVVKPHRGHSGRGILAVEAADRIFDLGPREWTDAEGARARLLAHHAAAGGRLRWQIEERIPGRVGPVPDDLKVFAFYGEIPIAKENRRDGPLRRNWYDAEGRIIETGWGDGEGFDGIPPSPDELAVVRRISLAVPAPFLRIDFLRAADGALVFCEFTPRPGSWVGFNAGTDALLGAAFARAEARLAADLAAGQPFEAFRALLPVPRPP